MTNEDIPYECLCGRTIWATERDVKERLESDGEVAVCCPKCDRVRFGDSIRESTRTGHVGDNYLHCIDYTGLPAGDPTGTISAGRNTLYVNVDGHTFTRDAWIEKYKNDPADHILERMKIHKIFHYGRPRRRF